MKNRFTYILIGLSLLFVSGTALAQHINNKNGISTTKTVGAEDEDGNYTITLETWATGGTTVVTSAAPADIVLVLDLSQSMTDNYGGYRYTARASQAYRYNQINNGYYLHSDGNYYPVSSSGGNNNRRLQFSVNGTTWYLTGTTATTTQPNGVRDNATVWTGVLYDRAQGTRLTALQDAVEDFLEVIYHNDNYQDKTDANPRTSPLGNRIAIVTFGGPQNNTTVTKIHNMTGNDYESSLIDVTNTNGSKNSTMLADLLSETNSSINNQNHYGTYADEGMSLANLILNAIPASRKENSSRTVVLFTDGAPGSGPGWVTTSGDTNSPNTANRTINAAKTAKNTNGNDAKVYTVILGSIANDSMRNYLDYTSSNYPDASDLDHPETAAGGDTDYSLEAGNDLSGVFTTIAHASGGSERPVDAETQVRDVVSSSFVIPDGFNADDVVFKVFNIVSITNNTWVEDTEYDKTGITAVMSTVDGKDMLTVQGFDYSKADNPENSGNGNWVGQRYINGQYVDKGRKLQIQFKIKSITGATGGDGTNTNDPLSGVYVKDASGQYVCLNEYDMPHTNLPITLIIKKTGLKHGESATFEIERCRPLHWDEDKTVAENIEAMEYNAIGKPIPDGNWDDWSKVILTNKGADRAEVTKTLLALDPHYIYRVSEDKWGWAYEMTGALINNEIPNTSTVEVNPFTFKNEDKEGVVKHAEAVSINHFGYTIQTGEFQGKQEEHYKSSKLESF